MSIILGVQTGTVRLAERIHWNGRTFVQWHHLRTSLLIALACFCVFGLGYGLIAVIERRVEPPLGLIDELIGRLMSGPTMG